MQRLIKEDLSAVHVSFKLLGEDEQRWEGEGGREGGRGEGERGRDGGGRGRGRAGRWEEEGNGGERGESGR